jgi:WS/DGAT/MGAT family acyltransferase
MHYLSPVDAAFVQMESPRTPMHVGGLLTFRLPESAPNDWLRSLVARLREQLPLNPPFNQRLVDKPLMRVAPAWETVDSIDIDYHLRHSALPYPGGERELGVLVARLHSQALDLYRPPWEFTVIEGLENRRFAVFLKVHHAAMDGMGALNLIRRWLSPDPTVRDIPAPWALPVKPRPAEPDAPQPSSGLQQLRQQLRTQLGATGELAEALWRMTRPQDNPDGGVLSALATPKSPLNVAITPQRRLATQLFDLARVKALGAATDATVNDICLAIVAGALRRYLLELGNLPRKPLVASVPVGLPRTDGKAGNAVAGFVVPLRSDLQDPRERLRVIRTVTERTKEQLRTLSPGALGQFTMLGMSPLILGQMTRVLAYLPPIFNLVVSNVVASRELLYLDGAELEAMYPASVLWDGYAANVSLIGYAGRVSIGITGCRDALPSVQRLAVYCGEALGELEAAHGIGAKRGRRR